MEPLRLEIPTAALEQIVGEVADRVRAELGDVSPWLTRAAAAEYLGIPLSRLEKARAVPSHKWDGRVLYNRCELDQWLLAR